MKESQRIQKVLAAAGHGSRRACEALVVEGRVQVNGRVVRDLPVLVDPATDDIRVDGRKLKTQRLVYYLVNKPKGVLCTNDDPAGRLRAVDLLKGVRERVYPVGRLDAGSTGLLLMTNDGDLAEHLTHPRFGIEKTYHATVRGRISDADVQKLKNGVWMSGRRARAAWIAVLHRGHDESILEIRLREGRNGQVRPMLAALGHKVSQLRRTRIGKLTLTGLGPGQFRALDSKELVLLRKLSTRQTTRGLDHMSQIRRDIQSERELARKSRSTTPSKLVGKQRSPDGGENAISP